MTPSERRFRSLALAAAQIVWTTNPEGQVVEDSPSWRAFTGQTYDQWRNCGWLDALHPDDRERTADLWRQAVATHGVFNARYRLRTLEGGYQWMAARGVPVIDDDGRLLEWVGTNSNISEQVEAEEQARQLNNDLQRRVTEFQTLLDVLPVGIGIADDAQCRTIRTNRAFAEMLDLNGAPNASLIATVDERPQHFQVVDANGQPIPAEDLPMQVAAREGRRVDGVEFDIVFEDGRVRRLLEYVAPLFDEGGASRGCVGAFVDLTEQRRASSALKEAEDQFRTLADSIPQLAWMARPDGHIFWYNRRWYEYTGTTLEDMEGWGWESVHDRVELDRMLPVWRKALATGEPWDDMFPLRRHDGQMRWHLSRALPLRNERGEVVRWFGTNTDITQQRELQEALRDADRRKDEFLAMLAHELRNPLAAIRYAVEAARTPNADTTLNMLDMIERQASNLARLIDDLIDISRISRDQIQLRREAIDASIIVQRALSTTRPLIDQKRHSLTVDMSAGPMPVDVDPTRAEQIVANLFTNAAKYTTEGGQIRVRAFTEHDEAVIKVADTGIGIAPDTLPFVFELFAQANKTLDRSQGGLGIGLTVVRKLTEMHGGTVAAQSGGVGQGSEFTVRLPLVEAVKPASVNAASNVSAPCAPLRVLVVDDNRDTALAAALLLSMHGHAVEVSHDGQAALDSAQKFCPQVILLDIGLPVLNGYEVASRLRQDGFASVPLIAVSGYGQAEDRERSLEAGFNHHLVKPVDSKDLLAILQAVQPDAGVTI